MCASVHACMHVCVCACVHPQNASSPSMYACVCIVQVGLTSLILAVQKQHVEIVESLLNANCAPNLTEKVSIVCEVVATLFINFCFSIDSWLVCATFCRQFGKFAHH